MKRAQRNVRSTKDASQNVRQEKFTRVQFPVLLPKTEAQKEMLDSLKYASLVVVNGVAGTGKSFIACHHAAKKLHNKDVKKVILIRAYQPLAGRSIGFLPGDLKEKLLPYYQQLIDYFEDFMGKGATEIALKNDVIEICSLETIRGRSWDSSIIIVDEAQSLVVAEVQALVTRLGEGSQMILCGDASGQQSDIKNGMNGLTYLERLVQKYNIEDAEFVMFTREDIVRSGLTKAFVIAFEDEACSNDPIVSQAEQDSQHKKGR